MPPIKSYTITYEHKAFHFCYGHAILHALALIRIRTTSYHKFFPLRYGFGQEPNISHIECAEYVLIVPPQGTKIGSLGYMFDMNLLLLLNISNQ